MNRGLFTVAMVVAALSACSQSQNSGWVKDGASAQDLKTANTDCTEQANQYNYAANVGSEHIPDQWTVVKNACMEGKGWHQGRQ